MIRSTLCGPCLVKSKKRPAVARYWDTQGREFEVCDECLFHARKAGFKYQLLEKYQPLEDTPPASGVDGRRRNAMVEILTLREHLCKAADYIAEKPAKQWAGWAVFLLEELEARDDALGHIDQCLAKVRDTIETRLTEDSW